MNPQLKEAKQAIRAFWPNYSDEQAVALLAHAMDGKFGFSSCCCLIGVPTADHALQEAGGLDPLAQQGVDVSHYNRARQLPLAGQAEDGFYFLGDFPHDKEWTEDSGVNRRLRRFIPMIKAELRRRARITQHVTAREMVLVAV